MHRHELQTRKSAISLIVAVDCVWSQWVRNESRKMHESAYDKCVAWLKWESKASERKSYLLCVLLSIT